MMPASRSTVSLQTPFDQRLTDLQAQIDRLSYTLQHWRQTQDHLEPMERELATLTAQCAEILTEWRTTGERHAHAVDELEARLANWNEVQAQLQYDATQRIHELERSIEHEWTSLRQVHEAPIRELREQAANLTEVCIAAAESAQTGLERADARLALLEGEMHRKMEELAEDVRAAVSELVPQADTAALRKAPPWSLDGVARLHDQLRESTGTEFPVESSALERTVMASKEPEAQRPPDPPPQRPEEAELNTDTSSSLSVSPEPPSESGLRRWGPVVTAVVAVVGLLLAGGFVLQTSRRMNTVATQATEAQQEVKRAAAAADERVRETREQAAREVTQAQQAAARAQIISDVLAAPDLIRFSLVGGDPLAARSSAQLLFSRSRGIVFSGSGLAPLASDKTYQIWFLTEAAPVGIATFVPDESGRATVTVDVVPKLPRVTGATVTVEPAPESETPTSSPVLARAP
jgi:hypothetical protein